MVKSPCRQNKGLKKGPWSPEEDQKLIAYVKEHGHGNWRCLPAKAGLQRCGKSCRLRWINYLKPDIKRGKFSLQEDRTIIQLHALLGNKWSIIAAHLPGRTDNEIKNYWNTHLKKRLMKMGIDPITHKPQTDSLGHSHHDSAYLRHMAQWESARLEAEARLLRESNSHNNHSHGHLGSSSSQSQPQPPRLIISKIPRRPSLPPCLDILKASQQTSWPSSSSTDRFLLPPAQHNNSTRLYNMYAIMLTNDDHGLESPASTLCFPEANKNNCITNVETGNHKGYGLKQNPLLLQDDDIMVAVEAFTSAAATTVPENNNNNTNTNNNIAGLSNNVIAHVEGDINDMSSFDPCDEKLLAGESGDEVSKSMNYWNSLLDLYGDSLAGSPVF